MKKYKKMSLTLWVVILSALTGFVFSHPVEQCAGYCRDTGKSQYEVGSHYVYDYQAQTVSKIGGVDSQEAKLNFSATVDIHILTPCEYILQVRDVRLNDTHRLDFSSVIEKNALRFWNHNGVIKRLCPQNEEPEWVLNIKRGILSTMQNSMDDLHKPTSLYETDIVGTCNTDYDVETVIWPEIIVRKTKDLQKCSDHVSSRFENGSPLKKSTSLLRGSYNCEQHFTELGSLHKAVCTETQLFQPFSNGDSGAKTVVSVSLTFKKTSSHGLSTLSNQIGSVFTTLKYGTESLSDSIDEDSEENLTGIYVTLQNLYESSTDGLSSSFPLYFSQLISEFQRLDSENCKKVISSSLNTRYHKLVMEALSLVRTDECLAAVQDIYSSGLLSSNELNSILSTIPFIKSPTLQTVSILAELIKDLNSLDDNKLMLTVSAVINSYCQKSSLCQKEGAVKQIMNWIEETLGDSCSANSRKQQEDVVVALKAIGNAGFIRNIKTLSSCFMNSDNPIKIRLAAIDALRKMDCDSVSSSKVLNVYTQLKENTEVRIAAYLMAMRCPFNNILLLVKNTLYAEKTNQVGSFVWTHLENFQNKITPLQHLVHSITSNSALKNKFNTDARRFSRNYQGSTYFDAISASTAVESNVVFSSESYLPRSVNMNLTVDVFGQSINLFDFGARIEGFENIVESIFEKNGYFPDENIRSMLESLKSKSNSGEENEIDRLSDTFVSSRTLPKNPQGSMYARIFGNELYLKQFDGLKELINLDEYELNAEDILRKALQSDIDFSRTTKFLDSSYEIPTSIGLPLKLKIEGTAALQFQSSARTSLMNFPMFSVKAFFNPSAVVTINAEMMIDAFVTKSGLISSSRLHTNTYLDLELDFQGGNLIDVKINVPRKEIDILSVSSQLFTVNDEIVTEVEGIMEDSEEWQYCTPHGFSKVIGFQMCSELQYANASRFENAPYFPLTGPFRFAAGLQKTDNFSAYHFRYQNKRNESDTSSWNEAIIFIETHGSKIDRHFEMSYDVHSHENLLSFKAKCQYRNESLLVSYLSSRQSKHTMYEVNASGMNKRFLSSATLSRALQPESGRRLAFNWDLNLIENARIKGEGNLNYLDGDKYNGHVTVHGLSRDPFKLKAGLMLSNGSNNLSFSMDSNLANIHVKGSLEKQSSRVASKVVLGYTLPGKKSEVIHVAYKWSEKAKSLSSKDKIQLDLELSEFPAYNTKIIWSLIRSRKYFDMNTVLVIGVSEWHSRQLYRNWQTTNGYKDFAIEASLSNPSKNLNYHLVLEYEIKAKRLRMKILGQLSEKKKLLVLASYEKFGVWSPWSFKQESATESVQLHIIGNCTFSDMMHNLEIKGKAETLGRDHKYSLRIQLPEALSGGDPITFSANTTRDTNELSVIADGYYKRHQVTFNLLHWKSSKENAYLKVDGTLEFQEKKYSMAVTGLKDDNNNRHLTVDLELSKHIHFVFGWKPMLGGQEIESKIFWDYDKNKNKTIGIYLYHSDEEKCGKLYLEDLFVGLKLRLTTDLKENSTRRNFLLSSSWGESESKISGELKLDGDMSDRTSLQFNDALMKNTIKQEFTLSASIATPVENFKLQWLDLMHVKEVTEESFIAENQNFWTSMSSKVSLSWRDDSDPLFDQELYFFVPDKWIKRKVGVKVDTTAANNMVAAQFLYFNDYSDVSALDVSFNHTLAENGFKTNIESSYNYALPLLHIDFNVNTTESRANMKFTSPTKILSSFTSNVVASSSFNYFIFETKWEPEKNITFWYSIDLPVYVGAEFVSPFQNYKLLTIQYKSKGLSDIFTQTSRKEAEITAQFNDEKATASFSGQQTENGFDCSFIVSCPPLMDTLYVFLLHDYSDAKLTEKFSIKSSALKQTVIETNLILDFQDYTRTTIVTDLRTRNNIVLVEILNKLNPEGINCSFSGKWNKEYIMLKLNGEYKNEIDEALVQFQLSASGSPFRKDYDITFQHSHDAQNYDSLLILPFGTKLEHSLKIHDSMNWHNSIVLKSSSKSSSIVNQQKYDSSSFENHMIAEMYGQKSMLKIRSHFNENERFIEDGFLELITPWSESINAKYSFAKYFKTVVLNSGEKSLPFTEHSLFLQYQNNKEISLKVDGHSALASYFVYNIAVKSPHYNNSHFNVQCDLTQPLKVGWATFEHNGHSYEMHFDYIRQNLIMNSSLTFSKDSYKISVSEINYNLGNNNKRIELFTITKNEKYNILLESQINQNKFRAQLLLNSPIYNWKQLIISLDYDTSKNVKMAVFNYERDADSLYLSSTFVQTWSSLKGSLALNTNVQNKRGIYSLTGECDYLSSDDLTGSLTFFNNDVASTFSAKWRNKNDAKVVKLDFTSPYEGYKLVNASLGLLNNTSDHVAFLDVNLNDFKLHSGMNLDVLKRNYSSFLNMNGQSLRFRDLSASFQLSKENSTQFNVNLKLDNQFVKVKGSHYESDRDSQLTVYIYSSVENYEHSSFSGNLIYPHMNSTEHRVHAQFELSNDSCVFDAEFRLRNEEKISSGSFNASFPERWNLVDTFGSFKVSPYSDEHLNLEIYLQAGASVNKLLLLSEEDKASLRIYLDFPISKLNPLTLSVDRLITGVESNYQLNFNSTNDLMSETFFKSYLVLSESELLLDCQSSMPAFQVIHVSSNLNALKDKFLNAVIKRNNNTMNASFKFDKNAEYDVILKTLIKDEYLNNWDIDFKMNYSSEKYVALLVEKENIAVGKVLLEFKFRPSGLYLTSDMLLNNHLVNLKLNHSNNSSAVAALIILSNETKLDLQGSINFNMMDQQLHFHSASVLLPYPYQKFVFNLSLVPENDKTSFTYTRANQMSNETRCGFYVLNLHHSVLSIENLNKTTKLLFHYDFKDVNKTISLHLHNGTKFLDLDGNLILSPSLSELRFSRASSLKKDSFHAKYNVSKGVDLLLCYNSAKSFKFSVTVDSISKVTVVFNVPSVAYKNLPSPLEFTYDFTKNKKVLVAFAYCRGSIHFVNAMIDHENADGIAVFNISSQFLPLAKKVYLTSHYNLSDLSSSSANATVVTDSLTVSSSMKVSSFSSAIASFMVTSSNKNRTFSKGMDLKLNFSGNNKTLAVTISKPSQNLLQQFFAQLYFKNLTADSTLIRKSNNSYDVVSLSYNFLNKRELLYSYRKNFSLIHELGFNFNDVKNSSVFFSNIYKINNFKLNYDFSKIDSMNFEVIYFSRKLNSQISSLLIFGRRTVDTSFAFFWNQTETTEVPTLLNHPIDLKISNQLRFLPEERMVKAVISLNEVDYFNFLLLQSINRSTPLVGELDLLHILLYKGDEQVTVRGELIFFEHLWGTDIKMETDLSLNEVSKKEDTLMNVGHFSLSFKGESKISAITIFDHSKSSNFFSFGSNIRYQSEYDHEFNVNINSSALESSQEIYSTFSWNDEILFLNFTFDLNIDKSVINATVKSNHFQDMNILLNYDVKSENKYARLLTTFGTSTYIAKAQSYFSPKNKTLQLKFKSPIQGFSLLQLSAELSLFNDDQFLTREKVFASLIKESIETKIDATFEVDSNPESPKLSILVNGYNIPEWNGKSRNWLITLHTEKNPQVNVAIKISKWRLGEELDAKKNIFIQLKGSPANMQLSADFPDLSKSIKASYSIALNKTQKSIAFNFLQGKNKIFIMNGFLNFDKIGVTNFKVEGFCHPFGDFRYSGIYKNRGKQSIILTLKHNENVNEIEGHFRYTIRSLYFDLEFDSSLNNEKHMQVKGTYDFNNENVKSASLYVYFNNFELKAKFGGKATAQVISADMLVQSTVKIIENVNLKFELSSPNAKENTLTLLAHINDVDYKLNCNLEIDQFSVISKVNVIFPSLILKDLKYSALFLEKKIDMKMELSGEKLVSLTCNYELNSFLGLFNLTLDANQRVLPYVNRPLSCLVKIDISQGEFLVDITKTYHEKTASDRIAHEESLLLVQGQFTTMSTELYVVLKYGNETNKVTLKQRNSEPFMKQTQATFFFELELPSLLQDVTNCNFRLNRSSLSSEEFLWHLDVEFKSPLKFLPDLVNHLHLDVSPNAKRLNFLLNLENNVVTLQESIIQLNFVFDNINRSIDLQMRGEVPNSFLPLLSVNSSCQYNLWEELKIKSQITIQNLLYLFEGGYKLDDEFHAKVVIITPYQTNNLKFGGFWKQTGRELISKLYINTFEVNYSLQSVDNITKQSFFVASPKHNLKFNAQLSGSVVPSLIIKFDYSFKKSIHQYQGSFDLKNNSLHSEFSLEESNQDWLQCREKNGSSPSACNSLKISKLKVGKISIIIDKISSEYLADISLTESELFNSNVEKNKHLNRFLINVTNRDSDFSFMSVINFKNIQNNFIEIVRLKNWCKVQLNFSNEVMFDFLKEKNSGIINLQAFEVSRHLDWAYDWKDQLNLDINFESSSIAEPATKLKSSLLINYELFSSSVKFMVYDGTTDLNFHLKYDHDDEKTVYFVRAVSITSLWGQVYFKTLAVFTDSHVNGEISVLKNFVQHFVSFSSHRKVFPLNSECTIVSPLTHVETLKISLKSENMTILFDMRSNNISAEPYLFIKAGFVPKERSGFLYFENRLFSSLKSIVINGSFLKDKNVKELLFLLTALSNKSQFEVKLVASHLLNPNQVVCSLSLQTPYERVNAAQFSASLPLSLSSNLSAQCLLKVNQILVYSGDLVFVRTMNGNVIDYVSNVSFHSHSHKFGLGLQISKKEDFIQTFEYFFNFRRSSLLIRYNNSMLDEINHQIFTISWNGQNILDAKLGTNFAKNVFLLDSELSILSASLVKKYATKVMFLNKKEKKIALWLICPQFSNKVGIDLGHRYESLFNNSLVIYISTPFILTLPTISLNVSNLINIPERSLALTYHAQYNNSVIHALVSGSSNTSAYSYNLEALWDESLVRLQTNKSISGLSLSLISPVKNFKSLFFNYSPDQHVLLISTNDIELLNMSYAINLPNYEPTTWYHQPFLIQITVLNPLQPVHFHFSQSRFPDLYEFTFLFRYRSDHVSQKLSGIGISYSKTVSSRNVNIEIFEKQLKFRKDVSYDVSDYFVKLILDDHNELGFRALKGKPEDSPLNLCLLTVFLPSKVLNFKAFKSPSSEDGFSRESSFGLAFGSDDKEIEIKLTNIVNIEFFASELSLRHFAYEHDIIVRTHYSPIVKRLQFIYSNNADDMFTLELQTSNFEEEGTIESRTNFIIVHRASKLMFSSKLHSIESYLKKEFGVLITYHSPTTDSVKVVEILQEYNKSNSEMDLTVKSNRNVLKLGAGVSKNSLSAKIQTNHKEPFIFKMNVSNKRERQFQIKYGESRASNLYVGMPSNKKIIAKMSTFLFESEETDALFTLQLNSSRLLWGKLVVPSETFNVITNIFQEYNDLPVVAENIYVGFLELGQENFLSPLTTIPSEFAKFLETVLLESSRELRQVSGSLGKVAQMGFKVMEENHFYCRDIYKGLESFFVFLEKEFSVFFKLSSEVFNALKLAVNEFILSVRQGFILSYTKISSVIEDIKDVSVSLKLVSMNLWNDIMLVNFNARSFLESLIISLRHQLVIFERTVIDQIQILDEMLEQILLKLENYAITRLIVLQTYYEYFDETVMQLEEKINGNLEALKDDLSNIEELRYLITLMEKNYSWLSQFHLIDLINELKYFIDLIVEMVVDDVNSNFGDYASSVQVSLQSSADYVEKYIDYPVFKNSFSFFNRVYQKLVWIRQYHSISLKMQENVRKLVQIINSYAKELEEILNPSARNDQEDSEELNTVVNINGNAIEFSQELPFDWDGFNEKPHFEQLQQPLNDSASSKLDNFNAYRHRLLSSLYYSLLNIATDDAPVSSLVPPFQAQGLLIGSQYYITFDGKMYNFTSTDCSYILAGDFERKTVFVTVNYLTLDGAATKKSVSVISQGHEIEINHLDQRVYIDGNVSELPIFSRSISVTQDEAHRIIVSTPSGFTVDCNLYSDICSIQINGWTFGKTGGLLGTYDNEPANDFSLPNGTVVDEVNVFAGSWVLQKKGECIAQTLTKSEQEDLSKLPNAATLKDCEFYFRSNISPFRSCFLKVKPEPFLELCKFGFMPSYSGVGSSFRSAAAAYITSCNMKSILKLPAECANTLSRNSSSTETQIKENDIVFLVEDKTCILGPELKNLSSKLSTALQTGTYNKVNFGVISFGGSVITEPHVRTMDGKAWTQNINLVGRTLPNTRRFFSAAKHQSADDDTLPKALKYSLKLPWHVNATKTVILITCSKFPENYLSVLPTLVENNIQLHVLSSEIKIKNQNTWDTVQGIDGDNAYMLSSTTPESTKSLLKQDRLGYIAPLLEYHGSIFNLNLITKVPGTTERGESFADIWSKHVYRSSLHSEKKGLALMPPINQWDQHEKEVNSFNVDGIEANEEIMNPSFQETITIGLFVPTSTTSHFDLSSLNQSAEYDYSE